MPDKIEECKDFNLTMYVLKDIGAINELINNRQVELTYLSSSEKLSSVETATLSSLPKTVLDNLVKVIKEILTEYQTNLDQILNMRIGDFMTLDDTIGSKFSSDNIKSIKFNQLSQIETIDKETTEDSKGIFD